MATLRCKEDKLWDALVHPHPIQDAHDRGLNNNMPRWKIPAKARNENTDNMIKNHHHLKGGFAAFYGGANTFNNNNNTSSENNNNNNNNNNNYNVNHDRDHASQKLAPLHSGGDRKHFEATRCEEKDWHPSFKKATLDILPSRPTGKRALTPPQEYNRTEVEDIPRGKRKIDVVSTDGGVSDLPIFNNGVDSRPPQPFTKLGATGRSVVRDGKTGIRVQDRLCDESAEEVALRKGMRKIGFVSNSDREFADKKLKTDSVRVQNEIEFRREYNARMSSAIALGSASAGSGGGGGGGLNRDASSRATREASLVQENVSRHRASVRRQAADRTKAYDMEIVRNLPAFVPDGNDD